MNLVGERILECRGLNTQKFCNESESVCVSHDGSVNVAGTVDREYEVPQWRMAEDELTCLSNVSLGEVNCFESNFELLESVWVVRIFVGLLERGLMRNARVYVAIRHSWEQLMMISSEGIYNVTALEMCAFFRHPRISSFQGAPKIFMKNFVLAAPTGDQTPM